MATSTLLKPLIATEQIQARIEEMAAQIRSDYGDEPILAVAVLKGSFLFFADLIRQLGDQVKVDFVQVSSYGDGTESSGIVQIRKDLDINIEGKNVLIVEDIVDTGATLSHLCELLHTRRPKSLKVASLLSKPEARRLDAPMDYVGFEIPNAFVVGYGLDHAERYRNLPYIAVLIDPTP
ncbi:MAG TPA: hypoxanthine phosphoribosyltransferase [Fimbriimonadaceae bacterium]|nr:hypoxanthine phosphoribosyltransferase [Fimbriimonadaceae bacterium]